MKILVVDDNPINRKYLRVLLMQEGHTVLEVEDGLEALHTLERENIDAVISDILMPHMDGYRLCYEIRKNPALRWIPFIAYSATYTSPSDEKVALDFGADKFLRKPAAPEVVIKALHEAVAARARRPKQCREPDELSVMKQYSEALVRKLEETNSLLARSNEALNERVALAEFNAAVSDALTHKGTTREILQLCAGAMVRHLDAAFARIWTVNENMLELQASAGLYTHIDGAHARVPAGQFKIGLIASERKPHLTNSVIGDPLVHDQEWAKREGLNSFAGYPLLVEERLVGVMAMFACHPLDEASLRAMESVAKSIAACIERKAKEEELRQSEERFRELADNISEIFFIAGPGGQPIYYVSPAHEAITGQQREVLYRNPGAWLDKVHPDDRQRMEQSVRLSNGIADEEYRILRPDGEIRWLRSRVFPVKDPSGSVLRVVGIAEDITKIKRAEEAQKARERELQILYELSQKILNTLDLHTVLEAFLNQALAVGCFDVGAIRLLDRENNSLRVVTTKGYFDSKNIEYLTVNLTQPSIGINLRQVISKREAVVVERVRESKGWGSFKREGVETAIMLPIQSHEELLGVVLLGRRKRQKLRAEEISLLEALASHAALAIQKASLHEQTQRNLERIRALHEINAAITSTLDLRTRVNVLLEKIELFIPIAAASTVSLYNRETGRLESFACRGIDERKWLQAATPLSRAARIAETRAPVVVRDIQKDAGYNATALDERDLVSYLGVPLLANDEVLGVLGVYTAQEHDFGNEEIEFFTTLAAQAAIAVDSAQLFEQVRYSKTALENTNWHLERSLRQLGGLYTALTPIAAASSPQEMMSGIIDRLVEATGADTALIRVWDKEAGGYPIVSHRNLPESYLKAIEMLLHGGAVHWVVTHGEPLIAADIATESRFKAKVQLQLGLRSCAVLPLKIGDEVRGVMHVASRTLGYFNEDQRDHLSAIAQQMSIALENRELFFNLKASRDQLERSNRVKSEFLSVMSHELRTPLNMIMGYAALLKEDMRDRGDRDSQARMDKIESQATVLLRLIDRIMEATQIESGSIEATRKPVSIQALFRELRAHYKNPTDKPVTLAWESAHALFEIRSDYEKLKRILQNLIDNAIKFTERGTVRISARLANESDASASIVGRNQTRKNTDKITAAPCVEFTVQDTGVGIQKENLPVIFEMFKQVDSSDTRAYEGVGLGLYIAKKYSELLGGAIEVESEVGKGSTFRVFMPGEPPLSDAR